jgi:glycoside/pentoside/hexuronide:cation symporter, GPH family
LQWIFLAGPIVFVMLGGLCVVGWKLDADRHAGVRAELDARDAALADAPILSAVSGTPPHISLSSEPDSALRG